MRILLAEDDPVWRRVVEATLTRSNYSVELASDGLQAWDILQNSQCPELAVLDWMMPGLDGVEVCQRLRELHNRSYVYVILLSFKMRQEDILRGFQSGVDDYVTKPFNPHELICRVRVGERILKLQSVLAQHAAELQESLAHVKQLQGMLPICMHCKKIRNDQSTWQRLEQYLEEHTDAIFSHGICEECLHQHYGDLLEASESQPAESHPAKSLDAVIR